MVVAQVWIEHANLKLDQTYSYVSDDETLCAGKRVLIDFNGRMIVGFVDSVSHTDESIDDLSKRLGFKIKKIDGILDQESLVTDEMRCLALWMAKDTISPVISCFQAMLPSKIKPSSSHQRIKMETWVKATSGCSVKLTAKQQAAYDALKERKEMTLTQWRTEFKSVSKKLEELNLAVQFQKEAKALKESTELKKDLVLSAEQKRVKHDIEASTKNVVLLHGVTGSGKTEIYLQMAREVIQQGRQVLILVPEISLTPQMVKRVKERFGSEVAIYHSGLNDQEKYEQYQLIAHHEVSVVVGTRSAVFMPFTDLGLIVMDEEHDQSYKQDSTPQYHCRDVCIQRAKMHGCKVVLGSATPSLDSYARAVKGVYGLVTLSERINHALPEVMCVSTREAMKKGQSYMLTETLKEKIHDRLQKNEQVILLLNRRGYSPVLKCADCGEVLMCEHCDVALSYHKQDNCLKCHVCGAVKPLIRICPKCHGTHWVLPGFGTQKLEEEVLKLFPGVKTIRMDADTTSRKNAHQKLLDAFGRKEAQILIGTQMIAKGLDYPDVTLVGVVNADAGLNHTDFRSVETTFHLIVQASGRSGRSKKKGEVILQAFDPNHYAIVTGAKNDYLSFFQKEMDYRKMSQNPPYTYLISIVFTDVNQHHALSDAQEFALMLRKNSGFKVLGPSELTRMSDRYRVRVLCKGKDLQMMKEAVRNAVELHRKDKKRSNINVDVNPQHLD